MGKLKRDKERKDGKVMYGGHCSLVFPCAERLSWEEASALAARNHCLEETFN